MRHARYASTRTECAPWVMLPSAGDGMLGLPLLRTSDPALFAQYGSTHAVTIASPSVISARKLTASTHIPATIPPSFDHAAPRRLATYLAGRLCATRALNRMGHVTVDPLPVGPTGAPDWPDPFVGSITHTDRVVTAVVAARSAIRSIGIDCEELIGADQCEGVRNLVCPEWQSIRALCPASRLTESQLLTLVFSAKESLYKCVNPIVRTFFEHVDVQVVALNVDQGSMRLRILRDLGLEFRSGTELVARFTLGPEVVYTAVALPADVANTSSSPSWPPSPSE